MKKALPVFILLLCSIYLGYEVSNKILDPKKPRAGEQFANVVQTVIGDPTTYPLVQIEDFEYVGGFRISINSTGESNGQTEVPMSYSEAKIGFNPVRNSLFMTGWWSNSSSNLGVGEFLIPELVNSSQLSNLNYATQAQDVVPVLASPPNYVPSTGLSNIGGMTYIDGELVVRTYIQYDVGEPNEQHAFVIKDPLDLENTDFGGYYRFAEEDHSNHWITEIPAEWQDLLDGDYIAGGSSYISFREYSMGPSAFVFDSSDIVNNDNVPNPIQTTTLLDFPYYTNIMSNNELGWVSTDDWDGFNTGGDNDIWTTHSAAWIGFIIPGTRTYAAIGETGGIVDGSCYKDPDSEYPACRPENCFGYCLKNSNDKYNYYWFFDVNDLLAVKNGSKLPHEVKPYDYGIFPTPFDNIDGRLNLISGGSYDADSGTLYLSLRRADYAQNSQIGMPLVMAFQISTEVATTSDTTCTSFTYSEWGACQSDNTQSRTITTSNPSSCTGGSPTTSQSCTYSTTTSSEGGNSGGGSGSSGGGGGGGGSNKTDNSVTPAGNARNVSLQPTFSWEGSSDAVEYAIYIGTSRTGYDDKPYTTVKGTSFVIPETLKPATEYYWRVDSVGTRRTSQGVRHSFTTGSAYTTPVHNNTTNNNVPTPITKTAPTNNTPTNTANSPVFYKVLNPGDEDEDVRQLQKALNSLGYTIAESGDGSPGNESTYFGQKTILALQAFQRDKGIVSYGDPDSTGYGNFGPSTLEALNQALRNNSTVEVTPTTGDPKRDVLLSQIAQLQQLIATLVAQLAAKTGGATTATTNNDGQYVFNKYLAVGDEDIDVKQLQIKLNKLGFTIASTGEGSPGNESTYFGLKTVEALKAFQCYHNIACSGSPFTTGYGNFGPSTREVLNRL